MPAFETLEPIATSTDEIDKLKWIEANGFFSDKWNQIENKLVNKDYEIEWYSVEVVNNKLKLSTEELSIYLKIDELSSWEKLVRFYSNENEITNIVYFDVEESKIQLIWDESKKYEQSIFVKNMLEMWLCKESCLDFKKIEEENINNKKRYEEQQKENEYIKKNNNGNLWDFEYPEKLDLKNTFVVGQGEGIIIKEPSEGQWLYTFGAGPCSIVIVSDPDTWQIGLAHVDALCTETSVLNFLTAAWFDDNSEITIISWDQKTTNIVVDPRIQNRINFMNCDLSWWGRNDAAWIMISNGKPVIVYWENTNIINNTKNNTKFMNKATKKAYQYQKQPLSVKRK